MAGSPAKSEAVGTAADRAPKSLGQAATVPDTEIARHAYDKYLARGREHGHDVEDWLQAERELKGVPSSLVA